MSQIYSNFQEYITPVYRSGSVYGPGNYRPIAIISSFSKVLEKLVYDQLASFLEKQSILFEFQFGFRKGHYTEHAILETIDNFKTALDHNMLTCGIFLDFSKAFGTINHQILLSKLVYVELHSHGFLVILADLNNM